MLSELIDKDPVSLLAGLGASAAVLMLVFKDTIMGFVSGVQLSANDMLKVGDWIKVPKYDADGVVTEVTLNTVKVRNWDNTVTTVPPYVLVSDSFQNWNANARKRRTSYQTVCQYRYEQCEVLYAGDVGAFSQDKFAERLYRKERTGFAGL